PLHRPCRLLRDRLLHPQVRLPRRLDSEPRRRGGRDGEGGTRDPRRREPAPALRADARRVGRALRPPLGEDPRARSEEIRRALPPHLARVLVRLRRDVPLAWGAHASFPDRVLQGQRLDDELPHEPELPLRTTPQTARSSSIPGKKKP